MYLCSKFKICFEVEDASSCYVVVIESCNVGKE